MNDDRPLSESTRVLPPGSEERVLEERVMLFACGLLKEDALDLVEGLSAPLRRGARLYVEQVLNLSSADRHGRLAAEFGIRPDGVERLRQCLKQADDELRRVVLQRLAPADRACLGVEVGGEPGAPLTPALIVLADRLIRECLR